MPSLILGYARVSTAEQAYESSLKQQASRLRSAGALKVYADVGSRTKDDRSGLMALLEVVRCRNGAAKGSTHEVLEVVVTRIDRLTASPGLFDFITKEFQKYKVTLQVLDEALDLDSVDGELLAGLKVLLARREVRMGGLRVVKSRESEKAKNCANFCTPWGYRYVSGRYELDHSPYLCLLSDHPENGEFSGRTKADLGREVVNLFFEAGTLCSAIRLLHEKYGIQKFTRPKNKQKFYVFEGETINISLEDKRAGVFSWSRDGIRHYLLNPVLCGHTPYNKRKLSANGRRIRAPMAEWDVRYNTHSAQTLLNSVELRQIESMLATNQSLGGWGVGTALPLTGLLICGNCGRRMKCKGISDTGKRYYQCKNYLERACPQKKSVRMDVAEAAVIAVLTQKAEAITANASIPQENIEPPELAQLRSQLAGLERLGLNPAIETAIEQFKVQIANLQHIALTNTVVDTAQRELLLRTISKDNFWASLTGDEKREYFRALVEKVLVRDGAVLEVILKL